jgi:Phage integrase, N-terminal SAM-like domain
VSVRYKTLAGYRSAVKVHLIPGLGAHRIDRIEPEHFETLYRKIQQPVASLEPRTTPTAPHAAFGEAYKSLVRWLSWEGCATASSSRIRIVLGA